MTNTIARHRIPSDKKGVGPMGHARTILSHTRSNLVAYIALFFRLSGSAAYAAAGGLLVYSKDIVDGPQLSPWLPPMATGTRSTAPSTTTSSRSRRNTSRGGLVLPHRSQDVCNPEGLAARDGVSDRADGAAFDDGNIHHERQSHRHVPGGATA